MKIRETLAQLSKNISSQNVSRKKVMLSYVSLFLVLMLLLSSTISWFTQNDDASFDTKMITMSSSDGMRVNNGEDLSRVIHLSSEVVLSEASSVDGRNIFFPTTGTFEDETANMVFREGNAGDKNANYYYQNFKLTSDSGAASVYVKSYSVSVGDGSELITFNGSPGVSVGCPIRIAFIQDSQDEPIVLDPSALLTNFAQTFNAVNYADDDGNAITAQSTAHSFADYFYGNSAIFDIPTSGELDITMVVWLEGTGPNCDAYIGKPISIDIDLETNWMNMEKVYFEDYTHNDDCGSDILPYDTNSSAYWVGSDSCIMTMTYLDIRTDEYKTVAMTPIEYRDDGAPKKWEAVIPTYVETNITFSRYNPDSCEVWNTWRTDETVDADYQSGRPTDGTDRRANDGSTGKVSLQSTRIVDGTNAEGATVKMRSLTYRAYFGNGWGSTTETVKRIVPGVGYWLSNSQGGSTGEISAIQWYLRLDENTFNPDDSTYKFIPTSADTYQLSVTLPEGQRIFQFYESSNDVWFGRQDHNAYPDDSLAYAKKTGDEYIGIYSDGGIYTFTIRFTDPGSFSTESSSLGTITFNITHESSSGGGGGEVGTPLPGTGVDHIITFKDTSSAGWVFNNVNDRNQKLYVEFTDTAGSKYYLYVPTTGYQYFETKYKITSDSTYAITGIYLNPENSNQLNKVGRNTINQPVDDKNYKIIIDANDNLSVSS